MGPGKLEIPFKVMHNGIITTDIDIVLDTWKNDFKNCITLVLKTWMLPLLMKLKSKNMTLKMTGRQNFKLP